jgi:hypothetical protein
MAENPSFRIGHRPIGHAALKKWGFTVVNCQR